MSGIMVMSCAPQQKKLVYPETAKVDTIDVYFGTQVPDPLQMVGKRHQCSYYRLGRSTEQSDERVPEPNPFRENLLKRLTELADYEKISAPIKNMENITSARTTVCRTRAYSTYKILWTVNPAYSSTRTNCRKTAQ